MTKRDEGTGDPKFMCDQIIWRALCMMQEVGAPYPMIVDRMLTAVAAHLAANDGEQHAAETFRLTADRIDEGALRSLGKSGPAH